MEGVEIEDTSEIERVDLRVIARKFDGQPRAKEKVEVLIIITTIVVPPWLLYKMGETMELTDRYSIRERAS